MVPSQFANIGPVPFSRPFSRPGFLCSAKAPWIILATWILNLSGCDPVRTIRHNVVVAVVDDHGLPVPDVNVSIKESWESWQTWGGGFPESERAIFRQRWESDFVPWRKGVTNAQGDAVIKIEVRALDWTKGNEPPPTRDFVANREHIIKLDGKFEGQRDELRVVMKPGASVKGRFFSVIVSDIEKPRYVTTRSGSN